MAAPLDRAALDFLSRRMHPITLEASSVARTDGRRQPKHSLVIAQDRKVRLEVSSVAQISKRTMFRATDSLVEAQDSKTRLEVHSTTQISRLRVVDFLVNEHRSKTMRVEAYLAIEISNFDGGSPMM